MIKGMVICTVLFLFFLCCVAAVNDYYEDEDDPKFQGLFEDVFLLASAISFMGMMLCFIGITFFS